MDHFAGVGGSGSTDLYSLLNIHRSATAQDIKRAYRRQALRYHPDKSRLSDAETGQFQLIVRAYEVLSDEKKRRVYDKYGERGISFMDSVPFLDPEVMLSLKWILMLASSLFILLLLSAIFVSQRTDKKVLWSWTIVLFPSQLALFLLLGLACYIPLSNSSEYEEPEEGLFGGLYGGQGRSSRSGQDFDTEVSGLNGGEEMEEDADQGGPSSGSSRQRRRSAGRQTPDSTGASGGQSSSRKFLTASRIIVGMVTLYLGLIIAFDILVALRLDEVITASWGVVFVPIFILEAFHGLLSALFLRSQLGSPIYARPSGSDPEVADEEERTGWRYMTNKEKAWIVFMEYYGWSLRVLQEVLLVLKLSRWGQLDW
ncbi:hypothetical protein HDU76_013982, partial [Blyttiomyces sp. JEL0837]